MTNEKRVINKFLEWYESLTPEERLIFERCLGNLIKNLRT